MDDHIINFTSNSKQLELLPKKPQGNNDYNNQVHLMQNKLLKMGFEISMVNKVIYYYKITSTEEGIFYLVKTDGMWNHSFIPKQNSREQEMSEKLMSSAISTVREKTNQELCEICGEFRSLHRLLKNSIQKQASGRIASREMYTIKLEEEEKSKELKDENEVINLNYNTTKEREDRSTKDYECGICLCEYDNPAKIQPCKHQFCKECFSSYLSDKIYNNNVDNIKCPNNKCITQLKEELVLQYLPDKFLVKYHAFKKQNEISKDPNKLFCPLCDSYGVINQEDKQIDKYAVVCLNGHSFCSCGRTEHKGSCYKEGDDTIQFIQNESIKKCPKCGFYIKKDYGCNHMTCGNPSCQYEFCWLCMRESLPDHFVNGECQGMQFIEENSFLFRLRRNPCLFKLISKVLNLMNCLLIIIVLLLFLIVPMLFTSILSYLFFVSNCQIIEMFKIKVNENKKLYSFIFWVTITINSFLFLPIYYLGLSVVLLMMTMLLVRKIISVVIGWLCTCVFGYRVEDNIAESNAIMSSDNAITANDNPILID